MWFGRQFARWREFRTRTIAQWRDYPLQEGASLASGRYVVERHIGTGSFGLAYVAVERESGVRRLLKHNKPSKGELGRELLRREGRWLEQLSHPGVPAAVDRFAARGRVVLVTELMEGRNLEQLLVEDGARFDERSTLELALGVADILAHVHGQGIVHLDVRLPNVLVRDGRVSLVDFGLARAIGERIPLLDDAEALLLPEGAAALPFGETKRRMRQPTVQADLYALGHLMLFLLYTEFEEPTGEADGANATAGWEAELRLSADVKKIVRRLLQLDPPYDSVTQFVADAGDRLNRLFREG